jgi:ubiquinone/menaquinone biosynthesis C-methylase UbiE
MLDLRAVRVGASPEGLAERAGFAAGLAPEPLLEGYVAFMAARAIMAGTRLGIYEALAERPATARSLAERLELDPAGTDALLLALQAQGYLERSRDGVYSIGKAIERWMLPGSPRSVRDFAGVFAYDMWDHFSALEDVLRTGRPVGLHERGADDPYWERYERGMRALARLSAGPALRLIGARKPTSMLDLAGGHGAYAMELCRRHSALHADVVDLPAAARWGRAIVAEEGMTDRVSFIEGDLFEADLGADRDLVTAFHIVHHLTPDQNVAMFRRAHAALRDGGRVGVYELERPERGKRGTQIGTLTGLLFFLTSRARTYAPSEVEGFLRAAGFRRVKTRRDPRIAGSMVVVGRR